MNDSRIATEKAAERLSRAVRRIVNDRPEDERADFVHDVLQNGCQSGIVGSLIYHTDTVAFYVRHRAAISALLAETLEEAGATGPADLFDDKWDTADPLANDTQNQNLLAWFAFEETVRQLYPEVDDA